jgi:sugar transferase (PEP-CTERM/EpsH1 system associated)
MQELLFLAHRFPYPPDKGEKIRSWNMIRHLAQRWRVHLGCLSVDGEDGRHLDAVRAVCGEVASFPVSPRGQKIRSLLKLRPGRPLMLDYYGHAGLAAWVKRMLAERPIALGFAYSTPMAQYLEGAGLPWVLDMVDVDSEKFAAYAAEGRFPMRHVWAREARTLLAYEERAVRQANLSLLVSEAECRRFAALAPRTAGRVFAVQNGVDLDYFHPRHDFPRPWGDAAPRLVFTGHMDYPPNAEAAIWFAGEVMPRLRRLHPAPHFAVVGANPLPSVQALAGPDIQVTGRVADVRPFVAHAAACVAPLRIARGIQNKVLEAMAMARPVVASPQAFEGVAAEPGRDLLVAEGAAAMAASVAEVLAGHHPALPRAARAAMEASYAWEAALGRLDDLMDSIAAVRDNAAPAPPARATSPTEATP